MSLSQVLAPQLQQSLALLQAPTLELKALVEQEVPNPCWRKCRRRKWSSWTGTATRATRPMIRPDLAEPPADVTV